MQPVTDRDEDIELILQHFCLPQTDEESFGWRSDLLNDLLGQHQIDRAISIVIEKFKVLESCSDFILCERCGYPDRQSSPSLAKVKNNMVRHLHRIHLRGRKGRGSANRQFGRRAALMIGDRLQVRA